MSGRELQRIEVLSEVLARPRTEISAAAIQGFEHEVDAPAADRVARWWRWSVDRTDI